MNGCFVGYGKGRGTGLHLTHLTKGWLEEFGKKGFSSCGRAEFIGNRVQGMRKKGGGEQRGVVGIGTRQRRTENIRHDH